MDTDWSGTYWYFMRVEASKERVRRRKHCYQSCGICDHCALYTPNYPECRRCYPPDESYRRVVGQWEHCRCRQLPWQDFVDGKLRDNLVLAPLTGGRRRQFREQVSDEAKRADDVGKLNEELHDALRR